MPRFTQSELKSVLDYEPSTGLFRWRSDIDHGRRSVRGGDVAGSVQTGSGKPRRMLWVNGRRIYASRAAYIYAKGDIPDNALVDHINGDTLDDRIVNLRLANTAQNTWNRIQRATANKKMGVAKDARGQFKARIQLPTGEKLNLGTWATEEEAHACYMGAAAVLHGEFWVAASRDGMVGARGFEPLTSCVSSKRSTPELSSPGSPQPLASSNSSDRSAA